jgi:TPR repeat protein
MKRVLGALAVGIIVALGLFVRQLDHASPEPGDLAPDRAAETLSRLQLQCRIAMFCPYSDEVWSEFGEAMNGRPESQLMLGVFLMTGDKVVRDEPGGVQWIGVAAEAGFGRAGIELNRLRRNGTAMNVDEARIAAGLQAKGAGDPEAMRALAGMYVDGRGVARDPVQAVALLNRASKASSAGADEDLASLMLDGAPGLPPDRDAALEALTRASQRGDTRAMITLSHQLQDPHQGTRPQPAEAYRWLMRAAMLGDPDAQAALSQLFLRGIDNAGGAVGPVVGNPAVMAVLARITQGVPHPAAATPQHEVVVAPDLVTADKWLLVAEKSPWHDESGERAVLEPNLTTAQLAEAREQAAQWHKLSLAEVMKLDFSPQGAAGVQHGP